jgi:hypothetical protein
MLITFIPNITIENLILAWLVLTALNVFFLRKYVINSFRSMRFIDLDFKDFKVLLNRSFYDFNNNLIYR